MEIDQLTKELLDRMGFKEDTKKPGDYSFECVEGEAPILNKIDAHVDFRKENGRRWARVNGQFVKPNEIDTIPILKQFKEERDKLQSSSTEKSVSPLLTFGNTDVKQPLGEANPKKLGTPDALKSSGHMTTGDAPREKEHQGVEQNISNIIPVLPGASMPPAPTMIYKQIIEDWEIDSAVFYGTSGSCKSKLAVFLALEAIEDKQKILFLDTERNLRKSEIKALGSSYRFVPTMHELIKTVENIPQDIGIVFCDSIGYHAYVTFCRADADSKNGKSEDGSGAGTNMKGKALLEVGAVSGILKNWAMNNNKIALMTNQADSPFGKGKDYWPESFADKASHTMKEEMVLMKVKKEIGLTRSMIKTNKSRSAGRGADVAAIDITNKGTTIKYFGKGNCEIVKTLTHEMKFI